MESGAELSLFLRLFFFRVVKNPNTLLSFAASIRFTTLSSANMPSIGSPLLNSYNPVCAASPCLQQVIGYTDQNPQAQYSACVSLFGSPVVTTLTPSVDVILETTTATVSYTDIIVSLTTKTFVVDETVTVSADLYETVTAYSTVVATVTTIAPLEAPSSTLVPEKMKKRTQRRGCRGSTTSSEPTVPSSSTIAPLFPIASNCPSREEYSSACACISAVATTQTVTGAVSTVVSAIPETVTDKIPFTSVSTVDLVVTEAVTATATATLTVTVTSSLPGTTTVTVHLSPTQSSAVYVTSPWGQGNSLGWNGGIVGASNNADPNVIGFVTAGGQPWLVSDPAHKLFACDGSSYYGANPQWRAVEFETDDRASDCQPITCTVATDGQLSCQTTTGITLTKFMSCYWGMYIATADYTSGSCYEDSTLALGSLATY